MTQVYIILLAMLIMLLLLLLTVVQSYLGNQKRINLLEKEIIILEKNGNKWMHVKDEPHEIEYEVDSIDIYPFRIEFSYDGFETGSVLVFSDGTLNFKDFPYGNIPINDAKKIIEIISDEIAKRGK